MILTYFACSSMGIFSCLFGGTDGMVLLLEVGRCEGRDGRRMGGRGEGWWGTEDGLEMKQE